MLYSIDNAKAITNEESEVFYNLTVSNNKGIVISHKGKSLITVKESVINNAFDTSGIDSKPLTNFDKLDVLIGSKLDCTIRLRTAGEKYKMTENSKSCYNQAGEPIPKKEGQYAYVLVDGIDIDYDKEWDVTLNRKALRALNADVLTRPVVVKSEAEEAIVID